MINKNQRYIVIATLCFILFLWTAVLSFYDKWLLIDHAIIKWLDNISSPFTVLMMQGITKLGSGEVIILLTLVIGIYLMIKKMWGHTIFLFTLTFGGIALNFLMKIIFQRERPGEASVIEVFGHSLEIASYSFPSGHSMRSVILCLFFIYQAYYFIKNKSVRMVIILLQCLLILLISFSRIIVGAHYPSDIFAAITLSIGWFYICRLTLQLLLMNKFQLK